MSSFITSNRYKIKRYLNQLFDLISEREFFLEMLDILDLLKGEIFKYCALMDLDFENFEKVLKDFEHDRGHYRGRSDLRADALRKDLKALHDLLTGYETNLPLYDRLVLLAESLDHNLSSLFSKEGVLRDDVISDFEDLQSLAPEIKECGFETYAAYRLVMRQANTVKPYIPLEKPDVDSRGKIMVRPGELKDLKSRTAPFLSALGDFIAIFHQPSPPAKEKDKEEKLGNKKEISQNQESETSG